MYTKVGLDTWDKSLWKKKKDWHCGEEKDRRGHVVLSGIAKVSLSETVRFEKRPKQVNKLAEHIYGGRTF